MCTSKAHPKRPDYKAIRFCRELYRPLIIHCISTLKGILSEKEKRCFCDKCLFYIKVIKLVSCQKNTRTRWHLKKLSSDSHSEQSPFWFILRESFSATPKNFYLTASWEPPVTETTQFSFIFLFHCFPIPAVRQLLCMSHLHVSLHSLGAAAVFLTHHRHEGLFPSALQ